MVYAFPALTAVGIVPFTEMAMDEINATLIAEGGDESGSGSGGNVLMARKREAKGLEEEVRILVER